MNEEVDSNESQSDEARRIADFAERCEMCGIPGELVEEAFRSRAKTEKRP